MAGKIAKLTTVVNGSLGVFSKGFFGEVTELLTGLSSKTVMEQSEVFHQLYSYVSVYANLGVISALIGLLVIVFYRPVKKWMFEVH